MMPVSTETCLIWKEFWQHRGSAHGWTDNRHEVSRAGLSAGSWPWICKKWYEHSNRSCSTLQSFAQHFTLLLFVTCWHPKSRQVHDRLLCIRCQDCFLSFPVDSTRLKSSSRRLIAANVIWFGWRQYGNVSACGPPTITIGTAIRKMHAHVIYAVKIVTAYGYGLASTVERCWSCVLLVCSGKLCMKKFYSTDTNPYRSVHDNHYKKFRISHYVLQNFFTHNLPLHTSSTHDQHRSIVEAVP
jgi:hypothetical protein